METRRTGQFLKFALGARSPDRSKQYYKNRNYTAPEEARLKLEAYVEGQSRTMYNQKASGMNNTSDGFKNES